MPEHVADELRRRGAAQANLYRALSNSPAVVDAWLGFIWALRDRCGTPRALREIAILRTAVRCGSDYEWAHHVRMAREAGVPDSKIEAVKDWARSRASFSDREVLALQLADTIVEGAVPEPLVRAGVEAFGPEAYVELAVTVSAYVMVPRVLDALRVPLESPQEGGNLGA